MDIANDVKHDNLEILLSIEKPDIICELNYEYKKNQTSGRLSFTLSAIDSYTLKVISSVGSPGIQTTNSNISLVISDSVEKNLNSYINSMSIYFDNMREIGREVELNINLLENSQINLETKKCGSEKFLDFSEQLVKKNAVHNSYTLNSVGSSFMKFSLINIPVYDDYGIGISVRDWLKPIIVELEKSCNLEVYNRSYGLGDGLLLIK